ncbi:MAG: putative undecaprenyl-phosphate N-acetylglucosaminyl 1-phosphate transferase [candidate division BRC1 bacterium ADurb.BinA364]|nr:MAG: putative undecaprenyl-phosphate N-acetylglucosaminyl 1-phosphate transferase [candidate division BRC1 bacterium ADurb.BinA364]
MLILAYALLFAQAALTGAALTGAALRLAPRLGYLDQPGERKLHASAKPLLGGIGIFFGFWITLWVDLWIAAALGPRLGLNAVFPVPLSNVAYALKPLGAIFAGSAMLFLLGLIDDRRPLHPGLKLVVQALAALPLLWADVRVHGFLPAPLGAAATVLWVLFLTNAFNFMDNMDGLCGGVSAICLGIFALASWLGREWFMAAVFLALAGAIAGFLRYNWFPSKLFMGDAGALSIGYLIAALSVLSTYYTSAAPTPLPILAPAIILGVPIFDSLSVFAIRWRERRPLWVGDTRHFSHRLVALGMTRKQAVLFIYLVTATIGLCALPLRWLPMAEALVHASLIAMMFAIIGFLEAVGSADPNRNRPSGD